MLCAGAMLGQIVALFDSVRIENGIIDYDWKENAS